VHSLTTGISMVVMSSPHGVVFGAPDAASGPP
jgi:hypothetical protein